MKTPRVYIDTSVIGGCYDEEFEYWSNLLVDNFRLGYFKPVVSQIAIHSPREVAYEKKF